MARVIDLPKGLTFHTDQVNSVFVKDLKKIFRNVGVSYTDLCCGDSFEASDSLTTGITAFAGGGQDDGVVLESTFNNITSVATAGDSVVLPSAVAGLSVTVRNSSVNPAAVFPASGDAIEGLAANASVTLVGGETATFTAIDATTWKKEGVFVVTSGGTIQHHTPVAINATASATADQIKSGYITSTSAATVTLTLPTATAFGTLIGASAGTIFEFTVDNTAGANVVTVAVNTGITVLGTVVITGSATLTVANANLAVFRLIFTSATAAKLVRVS